MVLDFFFCFKVHFERLDQLENRTGRFLAHYNLSIRYWDKGEAFQLGVWRQVVGLPTLDWKGKRCQRDFSGVLFWDET